ncbi:hypothetical protein QEZ40_005914, partial [Streptomyces katrae]|nr:hypothetical protein [Streptomyces katrae]
MPDPRPARRGRVHSGLLGALLPALVLLMLCASASGPPAAVAVPGAGERPVVRTAEGPVRGRGHGTYDTFEGIPYAAA